MSQNDFPLRERFRFQSAALAPDAEPLHVLRFSGAEGFSQLFSFDVRLATRQTELDVDAVLANPAALSILRPGKGPARFTGYPTSLSLISSYNGWQFWTLRLQPALWKLTQQVENRLFVDSTVEEIAREVLDQAASLQVNYDFRLSGAYGKQEFAMLHNESLYGFLAWKLERDGIYWFFEETDRGERVVFADAKEAHADLPGGSGLRYQPSSGLQGAHLEEEVFSFGMTASPLPRRVIERDYDWENPMQPVVAAAEVSDKGLGDVYYYGDGFTTQEEGQRLAEIRAQALRCRARVYRGESAVPAMRPGFVFQLANYFDERCNRGYLVTEVRHEGSQEAWLSQAVGVAIENPGDQVYYRNSFACIPDDVPFRPERRAERAKVSGMLTAFIDGSSDSAVADVNEKGCYRVIFPQDLSGRPNGKSSCWIRRMQPHVGLGHGMTFPLTPGIEVLVAFIDGNPDRPVIAGAVANAVSGASENTATAQSTAIRTAGGSGLVFNDKETKQGLHLGTGGHSGLFMSSGSLDALMAFSDFAGKLASGADTTFAGLAQHAISGFSSKLEANHKSFGIPTAIFEVLKDVSKVTACFDEGFWHAALENHDPDRMVSQCLGTGFEALTDVLKGIPATAEAIIGAGALAATDPFYGASITAKESQAKVALTTPMGPLQIAAYITFSILSWLASFGTAGVKAVASWLSAKQEIQQREKKLLVICLEEEYAAEMRTAHPDWPEEKVRAEATAKAAADVAAKGSSLLAQDKYREAVDAMEKEAGIDFTSLENAKWHRAGRAIAQSAATTLVPELVSIIAVCTKAGKFTSAKSLGGLLLCATDSNAVMGARKETRVSSDEKLFLTAGAGQSVYSRYTQGSTLQNNLEKDFGLDSKDSAVVQRADVLASLALKKSEHTSLGTIAAQAKDAITLTTKYSEADITRALTGCNAELLQASEEVLSHIKEYGTGEASISAAILNALKNMSKLLPKFAVPPTAYTELSLGKSGETQQAKLDCRGAGCTISLAGTATDTAGVFEAKMANSAGADTSALELKDDSASLKAAKAASDSSLSLASTKATLASQEVKLELDGEGKGATLTAGSQKVDVNDQNGWAFTSKKDFAIDATANVKIDGQNISLLKGKVKFSDTDITAESNGPLSLKGSMIKIG